MKQYYRDRVILALDRCGVDPHDLAYLLATGRLNALASYEIQCLLGANTLLQALEQINSYCMNYRQALWTASEKELQSKGWLTKKAQKDAKRIIKILSHEWHGRKVLLRGGS